MGWCTVWAYGLAAALAAWAAKRAGRGGVIEGGPRDRAMWLGVTVLLAFLCVNKQLNLQSLVTDIGRTISRSQGWYNERGEVQKWLIVGAVAVWATFAAWFIWRFRFFWFRHAFLAMGLFFLLTFLVVRAISLHRVDRFLGMRLAGIKMNWLLELSGICLVALAAAREIWRSRDPPKCS